MDALKYFSRMLQREVDKVEGEEFEQVLALLQLHPNAKAKIGPGVEAIYREPNPQNGGRNNGFVIHRIDGTIIDFSYRKCLGLGNHKNHRATQAFRGDVQCQIEVFKENAFSEGTVECVLTGKKLTRQIAHVDHHPTPFITLLRRFIKSEGLSLAKVEVVDVRSMGGEKTIKDANLRQRWQIFHRDNAKLRVIYWRSNLSKGSRQEPRTQY
jgi:hypothetical protein